MNIIIVIIIVIVILKNRQFRKVKFYLSVNTVGKRKTTDESKTKPDKKKNKMRIHEWIHQWMAEWVKTNKQKNNNWMDGNRINKMNE